ncbi:hypothetical protein LguiB_030298 [Lonicera macranthoides]
MLSIENPPPDRLCPSQSQLQEETSSSSSDEKKASSSSSSSSYDKLLALADVDLLKAGLDNSNPLPKFSIRNYVSSARRKNITGNWPFSERNLLLCLEHGVTNPLPPFQPLDSLRKDQSCKNCTVDSSLLPKEHIIHSNGELPTRPGDQILPVTSDSAENNQKLASACLPIKSINSERDSAKKLQSETATSCPQVASVPTDRDNGSVSGAPETLCEASANTFEAAVPPASHETGTPVEKCRLIVKLSGLADPNIKEDIKPKNSCIALETMASKLCPVCKTFSSSSNTTLNAHIDQCLSGESTMKWTANSKVVNHRIKPRKKKLMVDIYSTAPYCTLEELDRRNGRNWYTSSSLPVVQLQETQLSTEERVQMLPTVNIEDAGNVGAVYIDTDGTKVRILSKFNEVTSVSSIADNPAPRKILKGDKGSKFSSTKKRKKLHPQKHQKFLKLSPHSPKPCRSIEIVDKQTHGGQERNFSMDEKCEKEKERIQCFKGQEETRLDDVGTTLRSVCSEQTGLPKKIGGKVHCQRSGYSASLDHLLTNNDQSSFSPYVNRRFVQNPSNPGNPISSPESCNRMVTSSYKLHVAEYREQPPFRSLLGSQVDCCGNKSPLLPTQKSKQLEKGSSSEHERCTGSPKFTENLASSQSNKAAEMNVGPKESSNAFDAFVISSKPSCSHQSFSMKARRFSSVRKNLLSENEATVPESKSNLKRKISALKKHKLMQDQTGKQSRMEETTDKMSLSRPRVLKIRKRRGSIKISRKEEGISLKSSPQCYGHRVGETSRALAATFDDKEYARKEVQSHGDHIVINPTSRTNVEGSFASSNKSLDPKFYKLACRPCDARGDSALGSEVCEARLFGAEVPTCPTDLCLDDKGAMFCRCEADNDMNAQNANMVLQLDSKDGQGSFFLKVDAIPIPGPPGSFLPSIEDMLSEDLQAYSSLTTSRAHSFEDHDMVYRRDSSDSPVSTISNPTLAGSDSRSSEKLSVVPHVARDPSVHTSAERIHADDSKINVVFPGRRPLSFKNEQPCRCSRKEGASQGLQWSSDPQKRPSTLNSRSDMLSLKNYPSLGPEKGVPAGNIPMKVYSDAEVNYPIGSDCDLASPCANSNPVLRLMGKNLMVVKKDDDDDDDISLQYRQSVSSSILGTTHPNSQVGAGSRVSHGKIQKEDQNRSFHQVVSQSPMTIDTMEPRLLNNFRRQVNLVTPQFYTPSSCISSSSNVSREDGSCWFQYGL